MVTVSGFTLDPKIIGHFDNISCRNLRLIMVQNIENWSNLWILVGHFGKYGTNGPMAPPELSLLFRKMSQLPQNVVCVTSVKRVSLERSPFDTYFGFWTRNTSFICTNTCPYLRQQYICDCDTSGLLSLEQFVWQCCNILFWLPQRQYIWFSLFMHQPVWYLAYKWSTRFIRNLPTNEH